MSRFTQIKSRFTQIKSRFTQIKSRFTQIKSRMDSESARATRNCSLTHLTQCTPILFISHYHLNLI
jgi:hypothetical protein